MTHVARSRIERRLTPHYSVSMVRLRCGGEDFVGTRDHTRSMSSRFPMGLRLCSIPTAKFGKDHTGSDHSRRAPVFARGLEPKPFSPWEGKSVRGLAFAGLLRAFWLEDRALDLEDRYKSGIFWLVFREAHPQIAFTAFRPLGNLRPRRLRRMNSRSTCSFDGSCDSQLLLVSF